MSGLTWHERLAEALTADEIIGVVKDYLATWRPDELARLPGDCRPGPMRDGEDIALYAFSMVRHQCLAGGSDPELHRLATFFSAASHRLSQVMATGQAETMGQPHA